MEDVPVAVDEEEEDKEEQGRAWLIVRHKDDRRSNATVSVVKNHHKQLTCRVFRFTCVWMHVVHSRVHYMLVCVCMCLHVFACVHV